MNRWKLASSLFVIMIAAGHLDGEPRQMAATVQTRMASMCITPYLQCPLTIPIPVGSPCTCMTPQGPAPGSAN